MKVRVASVERGALIVYILVGEKGSFPSNEFKVTVVYLAKHLLILRNVEGETKTSIQELQEEVIRV